MIFGLYWAKIFEHSPDRYRERRLNGFALIFMKKGLEQNDQPYLQKLIVY